MVEAEGGLVAGEVAECGRAAAVDGVGGAELREMLRPRRHSLGQGEGVGDLEVGLEVHGAVEGALLGVEGDVPLVGRGLEGFLDLVGHVPDPGFLDEAVELGGGEAGGAPEHLLVDVRGGVQGQRQGGLGDHPGPPAGDQTGLDRTPQPRQAVGNFDALGEEPARAVVGPPQHRGELGHAELVDRR